MIYQLRKRIGLAFAAAMAVGLSFAGAASAQEEGAWTVVQKSGELRCGAGEAPPYVMKDPATGEYTGFFVEMCRGFAKVLEVEPVFVDTSWDNMVAGLQAFHRQRLFQQVLRREALEHHGRAGLEADGIGQHTHAFGGHDPQLAIAAGRLAGG